MTTRPGIVQETRDSQLILLLDDDVAITEGLAAGLEREGRTLITCNDLESAELMVERFHPSHIVADVRISGPFGCEGLDLIRYVRRYSPESRVILMSGNAPDELQMEGSERGAVAFLKKPFSTGELDGILNLIACSPLSAADDDDHRHIRIPMIEEVLEGGKLRPYFQPIVALDGSETRIGYESLARYRSSSPLRNPEVLFQYAVKKDRVADLEVACIEATLGIAHTLPPASLLFINIHPDAFKAGAKLADTVIESAERGGISLERIVMEITEQGSMPDIRSVTATVDRLRDAGVRFAFDDVGVAHSHLPLIGTLKPSFLKISQDFGTQFERNPVKAKIVSNIVSLARDFGCDVILEGIEDQSTAQAASELQIQLGQGYLFGRPADPFASAAAASVL